MSICVANGKPCSGKRFGETRRDPGDHPRHRHGKQYAGRNPKIFIASLYAEQNRAGDDFADISTGELHATQLLAQSGEDLGAAVKK